MFRLDRNQTLEMASGKKKFFDFWGNVKKNEFLCDHESSCYILLLPWDGPWHIFRGHCYTRDWARVPLACHFGDLCRRTKKSHRSGHLWGSAGHKKVWGKKVSIFLESHKGTLFLAWRNENPCILWNRKIITAASCTGAHQQKQKRVVALRGMFNSCLSDSEEPSR